MIKTRNFNKKTSDTGVRLGECRFCYAYVHTPRKDADGNDDKYSVCVLIPKTDKTAIKLIEAAVEAAKLKGKTSKWGGKIPGKLGLPLRDGDEEDKGPEFEGMMFFNASCEKKPGVVVRENGQMVDALDEDDFYSGCWGVVTVNFFPYDSNGNKGVGAGLNNLMKTQDDERLSGGATVDEDFGDMFDDDTANAMG